MRKRVKTEKELTGVGVGSRICHAKIASSGVFVDKIFIIKLFPINAFTPLSIVFCYVACLCHKPGDYSVESAAAVVEGFSGLADSLFASA